MPPSHNTPVRLLPHYSSEDIITESSSHLPLPYAYHSVLQSNVVGATNPDLLDGVLLVEEMERQRFAGLGLEDLR